MTLPQLSEIGSYLWIIPATLAIIAIVQLVVLLTLSLSREKQAKKQPTTPYMPTNVQMPISNTPAKSVSGKIVVISGLASQDEFPLPNNHFAIGRYYHTDTNVLIALDERSISRRHALFEGNDNLHEYYLTDTNSTYGTALKSGDRFDIIQPGKRTRIYNQDVVQFGTVVTVRFLLPGDTRATVTQL